MPPRDQTAALVLAAAGLAAVLLFVWIPADVQTGIVETSRRRTVVGDALAPAVAGVVILLGAGLLALGRLRGREETAGMSLQNLSFLVRLVLIGAAGLALMRWAGPLAADLAGLEYRLLRADIPWKYIGFSLGGWVMVFALVALAEGRPSRRGALFALAAVTALIAAYDLPFEDLLLPPNGDV